MRPVSSGSTVFSDFTPASISWRPRAAWTRRASSIFNVHSLVRTKTKLEAERVGKYMIRPVLSLDRLSFLEQEGKVGYRWGLI